MAAPFSLANIQGDILVGLPKQTQLFFFFEILDVNSFRSQLSKLVPMITTAEQAQNNRSDIRKFKVQERKQATQGDGETPHPGTLRVGGVNIAFSAKGINKLGITDANKINDPLFQAGMLKEAQDLGDRANPDKPGFEPEWDTEFLQEIHGVILITGDSHATLNSQLEDVKCILMKDNNHTIKEISKLVGDVRPGNQRGHEHFGYKDGISQPAVEGVDVDPLPGQTTVKQGVVLLRRDGDEDNGQPIARPEWALDGSFLAFRKLPQKVPEFDTFLRENAPTVPDPTANVVDLLGARLVGRWKSGAPIVEAQLRDDPGLADDPQRNNLFEFTRGKQQICPFAAHIRKMNPRGDLDKPENSVNPHLIPRRGIPFGGEVTDEERNTGVTLHERGLYFVCYQSNLSKGFSFLQRLWANNAKFPSPSPELPGLDAIIGQTTGGGTRTITGVISEDTNQPFDLTAEWVISKGGEYFFSPSLPALSSTFAMV